MQRQMQRPQHNQVRGRQRKTDDHSRRSQIGLGQQTHDKQKKRPEHERRRQHSRHLPPVAHPRERRPLEGDVNNRDKNDDNAVHGKTLCSRGLFFPTKTLRHIQCNVGPTAMPPMRDFVPRTAFRIGGNPVNSAKEQRFR